MINQYSARLIGGPCGPRPGVRRYRADQIERKLELGGAGHHDVIMSMSMRARRRQEEDKEKKRKREGGGSGWVTFQKG